MSANKKLRALMPKLKKFFCPELINEILITQDERLVLRLPFRSTLEYIDVMRDEFLEKTNRDWLHFKELFEEGFKKRIILVFFTGMRNHSG